MKANALQPARRARGLRRPLPRRRRDRPRAARPGQPVLEVPLPAGLDARRQRRGRDRRHDARRHGQAGDRPRARLPRRDVGGRAHDLDRGRRLPRPVRGGRRSVAVLGATPTAAASRPASASRSRRAPSSRSTQMGPRARVVPRFVIGGDADQAFPPACADKALEQGLRTNNLVLGGSQDGPDRADPRRGARGAEARRLRLHGQQLPRPGRLPDRRALDHPRHGPLLAGRHDGSRSTRAFTDPKGPSGAEASWAFLERYRKSRHGDAVRGGAGASGPGGVDAPALPPLAARAAPRRRTPHHRDSQRPPGDGSESTRWRAGAAAGEHAGADASHRRRQGTQSRGPKRHAAPRLPRLRPVALRRRQHKVPPVS